jgi:hypothetical protein
MTSSSPTEWDAASNTNDDKFRLGRFAGMIRCRAARLQFEFWR